MQVDDAFIQSVAMACKNERLAEVIRATLAVAAERGLVVPDGARKMWAVKTRVGLFHPCGIRRAAELKCEEGETVVRVAIVEIKE